MTIRPVESKMGPAKIADVARLAGVSVATVSRALANPDVVVEETRRKVLAAIQATGYTPNVAARNLRARKSMMVLVVVPDIANVFFAEVLRGIDETLSAAGYGLIIANLDNSADKEARYVELALAGQVDGVLLLCGHVIHGQGRTLTDANLPIIAVCERISGVDFPQIEIDNRGAALAAVRHLVELGHRRIAYISGPQKNILNTDRLTGYMDALAEGGITVEKQLIFPGEFTFFSGTSAAQKIIAMSPDQRPTGVFAANDEMAVGCLKALHDAGLRVPHDIAMVGFDGIAYADFCNPTLTTIVQPRRKLGARAGTMLATIMQGKRPARMVTQLHAQLEIRGSSDPTLL